MTGLPWKPKDAKVRRDQEEMGLTLAYSAEPATDASASQASEDLERPGPAPTDGQLIQRVGARDAGAFELLYRRYSRAVFGLALRRLGDRMRAEDAVQETFAAIWRSARIGRSAVRAPRGSMPSRGTRSSIARAAARICSPRFPIRRPSSSVRTSASRRRTSRGACTVRSKSSRETSAT